jgi:anhydro-N-acetylmuramic acid kinase
VRARDVCVCNQLLDELARKLLREPLDRDGATALTGAIHDEALEDLEGILRARAASAAPRSLGTGDEAFDWISRFRARVSAPDLCATACEALGSLTASAATGASRILLAGGGAHNQALVRAIASASSARVQPSDAHNLPGAFREAAEFALLGILCADRVPITLPAVTGVTAAPLSGMFTPAPGHVPANNQP